MKKIFSGATFMLMAILVNAQDPHFSQFFASPLTLNPALTGKFDGTVRAAGNYRNQWPAFNNAYVTYTASVDFPILQDRLPDYDTWGVGIMALNDEAGEGVLKNTYLGLSTSYHKSLDEDGFQQIGVGFQGVYGQKRLNTSNLKFEDMLTPFGFTGVTQEIFNYPDLNINYLDVNAGIIYTGSTNEDNNFYVGASMYHINRPKESFKGGDWHIGMRTTVNAGGYFPVSDILTVHLAGIHQTQNQTTETVVGGALSAPIDSESDYPSNIYIGSWFRFKDALIPYIGIEFSGFRIGASYDINTSSLRTGSRSRGGMELSLIYIKRAPSGGKGIPCPIF